MKLNNNTILITGGTSGIGLALGKKLKEMNNKVILLGRNTEILNELKKEGYYTICCDLRNQQEIDAAILTVQNKFPELNVLFNNAGMQFNYLFTDTVIPLEKMNQEVEINLTGQIILTHLLVPVLAANKNPYIINTTSGLGAFPKKDGLVYSATKAAMRSFTTGLRYNLQDFGIKVLEFIPPVTKTAMTQGRKGNQMNPGLLVEKILPQYCNLVRR